MTQMFQRSLLAIAVSAFALAGCSKSSSGNSATPQIPVSVKAQNGLSTINDGTAPSPDRVTIDKAMARAQQEHKSVIIEMGAAWCGPCTQFGMDLDGHPEDLKDLSDLGFIMVKAEFERTVTSMAVDFVDLNDFLPSTIFLFPSYFAYTPGKGWISLGTFSKYADLKKALQYPKTFEVMSLTEMKTCIEQDDNCPQDEQNRLQEVAYGNPAGQYSYADLKAIVKLFNDETQAHPNLGLDGLAQQIASEASLYFAIGAIDLNTLKTDFSDVAKSLTDASDDSYSYRAMQAQVANVMQTKGLKEAVKQCPTIAANYKKIITPGKLSAGDFQTKMSNYDQNALVMCTDLEVRANGATEQAKADYAKIDAKFNLDWELQAAMGDTDAAVASFHSNYQQYADGYKQNIDTDNQNIDKDKQAGDQTKLKDDQDHLAFDQWRADYHQSVDTEVESNLKNKQPVTVLRVLN